MKKSLFLLTVSLLYSLLSFSQNQWQWLNPQPSGFSCLKIVFTNHQTGFILNSNGDLIKTTNQGNNWQAVQNFPDAACMDIADSNGVIAGNAGAIYISSDNGNSWNPINTGITDNIRFANVVSRDTFFLSTAAGVIYETGNRGKTFTTLNCNSPISCISFVNSTTAFAGGNGILKTSDGGHTWQTHAAVNYSPSSILAIQFLNHDTGYAFRESDSLLVTHDGGNTWQAYNGYESMYAIDFINSTIGYLGGRDGALYRSADGGMSFTSVSAPGTFLYNYDINALNFLTPDTGFAVGFLGRIIKTTDSGKTWMPYSPTYNPVPAVSFGSASTGYAITGSSVLKTIDSGHTWNALSLIPNTGYYGSSFKYVRFNSADTGYVLSDEYAQVHKTNDGGKTWTTINPASAWYDHLLDVNYTGPNSAVLCMGTLLAQTKDGGDSWTPLWTAQYSNQYFQKIFFVNATTAFAINNNQLYKTNDGFQTWSPVTFNSSGTGYAPTSIWFLNDKKGFVTDEESEIFVTNDGGNTWQPVSFSDSFIFDTFNSTIRFFNDQTGYFTTGNIVAGGSYGRTYKTTDGGLTWQLSYPIGGVSIEFTPDSNVVIAGNGGVILKSPIKGWQTDSFAVKTNNACGDVLSASIAVSLGTVDSIQFVVTGPNGLQKIINSNPGSVTNNRIAFSSTVNNLAADSSYSASLRFLYNGNYVYSNALTFIAHGLPQPFVYDSLGTLISSAVSGNQWYLNGVAIPGASQRQWQPAVSGNYSVKDSLANCSSPMSASIKIVVNNLGVLIYPNPVTNFLYLNNTQNRYLRTAITDLAGRAVTAPADYYGQPLQVTKLTKGEYILQLQDKRNNQTAHLLFVKL